MAHEAFLNAQRANVPMPYRGPNGEPPSIPGPKKSILDEHVDRLIGIQEALQGIDGDLMDRCNAAKAILSPPSPAMCKAKVNETGVLPDLGPVGNRLVMIENEILHIVERVSELRQLFG